MKRKQHVTLHDVAKDAGVSITTVSLVLRESKEISEHTSKKVLNSMRQLGYVYNRLAANLRSNKSSTVGIIINDINNPVFSEMIASIQAEFDNKGYTLLQGNTFYSLEKQQRLLKTMVEQRVAGLILSPISGTTKKDLDIVLRTDIPIVLISRKILDLNIDFVGSDFVNGAEIATQHLLKNGHRCIALLGGTENSSAHLDRIEGYISAFKKQNLPYDPSLIIPFTPTHTNAYNLVASVIDKNPEITAMLCHNDIVAIGISLKLEELGMIPGKAIAIIGFDNIEKNYTPHPTLTTIFTHTNQQGKEAAHLLYRRIKGFDGPPVTIMLPPELIIRQSTMSFKT